MSPGPSAGEGELEDLYDKEDAKAPENKTPSPTMSKHEDKTGEGDRNKLPNAQNLSDLAKLAPFSDIAVIQRRFLPKTGRFELSASAFTNLNNPFFTSYGAGVDVAYYLRERWALELIGDFSTSSSRQVTNDLAGSPNHITTSNLVTSNAFYGAAIKWNPIYGKITWLNHSIVPFDLNFSVGGGMTQTTDGQSVPTLHLATSQVFAWTKGIAFRWDLAWNMYQANATDLSGNRSKLMQNDLYLGLGMSFYFPEASYR